MLTIPSGRRMWTATLGLFVLAATHGGLAQGGQQGDGPPAFAGGQMIRGTVTAVTPDHLTVKTQEGDVYQVVITPSTQVRKGRDQMKFADIHAQDGLGAMGVVDAPTKTVHAAFLMVVDAEQLKKAREAMGKTYIAGKVTKIDTDALKLTILREDGVSQIIGLDDDTSFKRGGRGMMNGGMGMGPGMGGGGNGGGGNNPDRPRRTPPADGQQRPQGGGGESITLADLKVGDMIAGPGAIQGGVFIPTEVRVADPAAQRPQRRRNPDGTTPAPAAPAPAEPKA